MGMFAMRKPRGFNHSYIYVDERKEKLQKIEETAKTRTYHHRRKSSQPCTKLQTHLRTFFGCSEGWRHRNTCPIKR